MTKHFDSFADIAIHFATLGVAVAEVNHHAVEKAALMIENSAKAELGNYQPATGPFNEWAPLTDATLKTHESYGMGDTPLLLTGQLRDSIQHEVSGMEAIIGTKMEIGEYQEVGTSKIPPRPFMGPAAYNNLENIKHLLGKSTAQAIAYGAAGAFIALDHDKAP
jgi:HK97 gp10 family phage protein